MARSRGGAASRRRFLFRLLAVTVPLLLAAAMAEGYLRYTETRIESLAAGTVVGPEAVTGRGALLRYTAQGRRLVPGADVVIRNHHLSRRDIPMKINSLGFRDVELTSPKPADEVRVLVLGDSITWGDYLPAEEVYVERAEHYLDQTLTSRRVQVINAGVGDIGLKEEVQIFRETGWKAEPDVVLVAFYLNDSRPPWGFPGELDRKGWLRRQSFLVDRLVESLQRRRWLSAEGEGRFDWLAAQNSLDWRRKPQELLRLAALARFDWGSAWQSESWERLRAYFEELLELAEQYDFRLGALAMPVAYQVHAEFVEDEPQRRLQALGGELGFPVLDLLPVLRPLRRGKVFFDQCHPTAPSNDRMGESVADFLKNQFFADLP